jgi:hypothetical protein
LAPLRSLLSHLVLLVVATVPLTAQANGFAQHCYSFVDTEPQRRCAAVAQAAESAPSQIGILVGGGNPILGVAGTGGLRLAGTPRIDISPRLNLAFVRLPDILAAELGSSAERINRAIGIPAPALATTVSAGVFPGVALAPGVGGFGAVDLLVGATWLPFGLIDIDGFSGTSPFAWSLGGRLGLLRESFAIPAVSLSVLRRSLGRTTFGQVCRSERTPAEECLGPGDVGEFSFELRDWSSRLAVSKRYLGLAGAAGVGYDRFSGDVGFAFRYPTGTATAQILRFDPAPVRSSHWSLFANLGLDFLVTSIVLEGGWMQGGSANPALGPDAFDPRDGTWFGSLGGRIGF